MAHSALQRARAEPAGERITKALRSVESKLHRLKKSGSQFVIYDTIETALLVSIGALDRFAQIERAGVPGSRPNGAVCETCNGNLT